MKKKAFFSLFVAMLLSFGMMAKSNHIVSTVKHDVVKKHNVVAKKVVKAKAVACVDVTLSCGIEGTACGDTLGDIIDIIIIADDILC